MVPDLALQSTLIGGLRALKQDPRQVDRLFANLPSPIRGQVSEFLTKTPIHFTHGYPMEVPKLPSVTLLLRREGEAAALLGQTVDPGRRHQEEFLSPGARRRGTESVTSEALAEQRGTAFPDEVIPPLFHEADSVEMIGRVEQVAYDAEVRTGDYFATAFLYQALKAILVAAEPALEAWGLYNLAMTGSDVQHTGQELPLVFTRVLSLAFQHVFEVDVALPRVSRIEGSVEAGADVSLSWQVTIA